MKQPELGKRLTELRKTRGLTQEELVERCNISVRTIQRIETGEVMPRSYTIKTIVSALDYTFEEIFTESPADGITTNNETRSFESLSDKTRNNDAEPKTESEIIHTPTNTAASSRIFTIALISGFIYFILTFPESIAEYYRYAGDDLLLGNIGYITLKVLIIISFLIFQIGYIKVGDLLNHYVIRIAAITHIVITTALCIYDISSVYIGHEREFMIFTVGMLYGTIGLLYGYALIKLRRVLGRTVLLAGVLEILSACLFLTVILIPLGDVINMFAELLELIVLFKVIDMAKRTSTGRL